MITDGQQPTGDGGVDQTPVKLEEMRRGVIFYGVGVEKADLRVLGRFTDARQPLELRGLAFGDLFM